jgi:hypothetical protein
MSNSLPERVPLDVAASWLSKQFGYTVTEEYFHQLAESEGIELENRLKWLKSDPEKQLTLSKKFGVLGFKSVYYILRSDLLALAKIKSAPHGAVSTSSYEAIIGFMRDLLKDAYPKDTALIADIEEKNGGRVRGLSKRTLEKVFARGREALKNIS